jgi:hypothetical protein
VGVPSSPTRAEAQHLVCAPLELVVDRDDDGLDAPRSQIDEQLIEVG